MKVSVCIPTYNQGHFLELAVRSAFQQSLPPFEIIVSNDCSSDSTYEVLAKLSKEINILQVFHQPVNKGIAKNTDSCMRLATGDFVLRLDSDDYLSAEYIEKLSRQLLEYPAAGYAHAAVQEIDQNGKLLKIRKLFRSAGFQSSDNALKAAVKGYRVAANIIMFRKDALAKVNYLSGRPNFGEDYHLASSISAAGFGNVYLNEVLSFYRVWIDNKKVRQKRKLDEINGILRVFEDVIEPAYKERGWDLREVKDSRTNFACHQANCLGWEIYSREEKVELALELSKLSSAYQARITAWLYVNGCGKILHWISQFKSFPKRVIKKVLVN